MVDESRFMTFEIAPQLDLGGDLNSVPVGLSRAATRFAELTNRVRTHEGDDHGDAHRDRTDCGRRH